MEVSQSVLFEVSGRVQKNKGRGRALGFPTANIPCSVKLADGIYIARWQCKKGVNLPALLFIGKALTFGDAERLCEIYILDFDENIEGVVVIAGALKKIRDNKKFQNKDELITAIREDERQAREYFKEHPNV